MTVQTLERSATLQETAINFSKGTERGRLTDVTHESAERVEWTTRASGYASSCYDSRAGVS